MKLRTYQADTMAAALALVKNDLGADAVIVNTRTIDNGGVLGLGRRALVEITATNEPMAIRRAERQALVSDEGATAGRAKTAPAVSRASGSDNAVGRLYGAAAGTSVRGSAQAGARANAVRSHAIPQLDGDAMDESPMEAATAPGANGTAGALGAAASSRRPGVNAPPTNANANRIASAPLAGNARGDGGADSAAAFASMPPLSLGQNVGAPLPAQMSELRRLVERVLHETRRNRAPDMPEALLEMYTQLISQQVAEEIATRVVEDVHAEMMESSPDDEVDEAAAKHYTMKRLSQLLPPAEPLRVRRGAGPTVVALVGPTGVGKTTTIAKLAAQFKLREQKRVGLITADTYRIAAVEQLKVYANILDVPLTVVATPEEMPSALERMADLDLVLIDTAGRSPRDSARLDELSAYMNAAAPDEIHLVVSANAAESTVLDVINRFRHVGPGKIIFTKIDEVVGVGLIFNVLANVGLRWSYITTGQSVPNDIEIPHSERLAQLLMGGAGDGMAMESSGCAVAESAEANGTTEADEAAAVTAKAKPAATSTKKRTRRASSKTRTTCAKAKGGAKS